MTINIQSLMKRFLHLTGRKAAERLLPSLIAVMLSPLCTDGGRLAAQTGGNEAKQDKVIQNTRLIGVGGVSVLDTYLSPEEYSGTELRYISHTVRGSENRKWRRLIIHQGVASYSRNRADNANGIAGDYEFCYGFLRQWTALGGRLDIKAGGMADANVGFLYNTRNGNNPAQARLSLDIAPVAMAAYRFSVAGKPLAVRYEVSAPLAGLRFSPNYGQYYYEIFSRGDYDHNIVPTTFIATPSLRHSLSLDFRIARTTVRLGYLGDYRQAKVNSLKYHSYSHMFVVGITRTFKITKIEP